MGGIVKKTDVTFILDRSGSMWNQAQEAIGGFNSFLKDQKEIKGPCHLSVILFDHEYQEYYSGELKKCDELDHNTYVPRGTTALLDAVGRAIRQADKRKATQRIVAVLTDGLENASQEFKVQDIKRLLEKRQGKGWEFLFLGAGLDNWDSETDVLVQSVPASNVYASSIVGTKGMSASLSNYTASTRSTGSAPRDTSWQVDEDESSNQEY